MGDDSERLNVQFGVQLAELKAGMDAAVGQVQASVQGINTALAEMAAKSKASSQEAAESFTYLREQVSNLASAFVGMFGAIQIGQFFKSAVIGAAEEERALHGVIAMIAQYGEAEETVKAKVEAFVAAQVKQGISQDKTLASLREIAPVAKGADNAINGTRLAFDIWAERGGSYEEWLTLLRDLMADSPRGVARATKILGTHAKDCQGVLDELFGRFNGYNENLDDHLKRLNKVGSAYDKLKDKVGENLLGVGDFWSKLIASQGPSLLRESLEANLPRYQELTDKLAAQRATLVKGSDAWRDATQRYVSAKEQLDGIKEALAELNKEEKVSTPPPAVAPRVVDPRPPKDGAGDGAGDGDTRLQEWDRDLEMMKASEDAFHTFDAAAEADFWQKKIALATGNSKLLEEVTIKMLLARRTATKQSADAEISEDRLTVQDAQKGSAEKVAAAQKEFAHVAKYYAADTSEYRAALKAKQEAEKEYEAQQLADARAVVAAQREAALGDLQIDRAVLDQKHQLHQVSDKQYIAALKSLENQEYAIKMAALKEDLELAKNDPFISPAAITKLQSQIEQLTRQHTAKLTEIDTQYVKKSQQLYTQLAHTITSSMGNAITGMIEGTMTLKQAVQDMCKAILQTVVDMLMEWLEEWIEDHIIMKSVGTSTMATEAMGSAALAGVNAMASVAAIPYYGWAMAIPTGESVYAAASAMALKASAAGGWDFVPGNVTTQLHYGEMVLSNPLATGLRNLVESGGWQGGAPQRGGGQGGTHFTIHAVDAVGVQRILMNNKGAVAKTLKAHARANNMSLQG